MLLLGWAAELGLPQLLRHWAALGNYGCVTTGLGCGTRVASTATSLGWAGLGN